MSASLPSDVSRPETGTDHRPDHVTPGASSLRLRRCGLDLVRRERGNAAAPGARPGFLQPVRPRCGGADEILHAHNDDCGLAAAIDDEAFVVLGGEVHDLTGVLSAPPGAMAMRRKLRGRCSTMRCTRSAYGASWLTLIRPTRYRSVLPVSSASFQTGQCPTVDAR
jgi:hypothetical protein